jgi:hypothetical protein
MTSASSRTLESALASRPSTTSRMSSIVFSSDRRRVEGDVLVVPSEAWRPWPRRHEAPLEGETGDEGPVVDALMLLTLSGGLMGEVGWDAPGETMAPSSGSIMSGGRRSFSMSLLRLDGVRTETD